MAAKYYCDKCGAELYWQTNYDTGEITMAIRMDIKHLILSLINGLIYVMIVKIKDFGKDFMQIKIG